MKTKKNLDKSTQSVKLKWTLPDKPRIIFLVTILVLCTMILLNELLDFSDLLMGAKTNPIDWSKFATEMFAIMLVTLSGIVLLRKAESKSKQAEEALKQSEREYRGLFESAHDAIIIFTPEGEIILDANQRACNIYGFDRSEFVGMTLDKISKDIPRGRREIQATLNKGFYHNFETVQYRKDGTEIFLDINASVIDFKSKRAILSINRDITERKRVEEALKQSEERLKRAQVIAHIGNWDWNIKENTLFWSDELYRIFSVSQGDFEFSLEAIESLIHPEDRDSNRRYVKELLESSDSGEYSFRIVRLDGEVRYVNQIFEVVRDDEGKAIRAFGTMQDITERKRAEEEAIQHTKNIESLSKTAMGLMELPAQEDIYRYIGEQLRDLIGDAIYILVNSFDQRTRKIQARAFLTDDQYMQVVLKTLGTDPMGMSFVVSEEAWNGLVSSKLVRVPGGIHELSFGKIPKGACDALEKLAGTGDIFAMGFSKKGELYGSATIIMREGCELRNSDIVETFMHQAGVAFQRKRAEEALRESEERFRQLAENIDQVFWLTDWENDKLLYVSPSYEKMFGRSCQSAYQDRLSWYQIIHPDDRDRVRELLVKNAQTGQNTEVEYRIMRDDGEVRWILDRNYPVRNQDGKVYRIVSIGEDITERKRAEEALKKERQRLFSVLDVMPTFVYLQAPDYSVRFINRRFRELFGNPGDRPCYEAFYGRKEPCDPCITLRVLETRAPQTWEWTSNEGRTYMIHEDIFPSKDDEDLVLEIGVDITERKRAEEVLRERECRLTEAQRIGRIGNWEWIPAENKVIWSAEMYAIFGIAPESVRLTTEMTMQAFHPEDRAMVAEVTRKTLEELKPHPIECRIIKPDGTIGYVYGRGEVVLDANGKLIKMIGIYQDITERKKAEEALRKSEDRYRSSIELTNQLAWTTNADGEIVEDIPTWRKYTGQSYKEVKGHGWSKALHPDDVEQAMKVWTKAVETKSGYETEYRIRRYDGVYRDFLARGIPVFQEDGSIQEWVGTCIDITERKRAEEEIRKLTQYLESIIDNANVWLDVLDEKANVMIWNKAAEKISGYSREEVVRHGKIWEWLYPNKEYRNHITAKAAAIIEKGEEVEDFETTIRCKDGEIRTISWNSRNLVDEKGTPIGSIALGRDVTERKRAEKALRDSEEKHRTYVENAPDGIFITDLNARYTDVNQAACRITGYSRDELLNMCIMDLVPSDAPPEAFESFEELKRNGKTHGEIAIQKKDGSLVNASLDAVALSDERYMAFCSDITERKKMEAQLMQAERLVAVGTLAYGIAHEFNNVLAGILGNAEFGIISHKPKEVKECLRIIMENCDRAKSITNNLLAFSTHRTVRKEVAGVANAVESVLNLVERELEKRNIKVARKFDAVPNIYCDIGELSQVVLNMVTNARDAMTPKGGTLTVEISEKKDNIEIIFSDTGCGIPNSIKSRIFEPFVTTKGALGQSEIPGTGLGLFLSYGIISRYGGKIEVESKVDRGSRFTITIPISINQTPPDFPAKEERSHFVPENLNILLVDDEKPILNSIKNFLETKGHTVVTTSSGKKGLRFFKDQTFDLVLSDVTMPDMDGLELISKLKSINGKVKLIAITGHLEEEKLESAQKAGADQILIKPFRKEDLLRIIARALSS